jgi:hypothetical protein
MSRADRDETRQKPAATPAFLLEWILVLTRFLRANQPTSLKKR